MPTATLADLQTKAGYVLDLANKLLVDNAQPIHQTIENVQTFSMALANNTAGVDGALQGMADLGKAIQPLATRLQTLSDDADRVVKAIEPDKVHEIVDNVASLVGQGGRGAGPGRQADRGKRRGDPDDDDERQRLLEDPERQ